VVISDTVTVFSFSSSESRMLKAMVDSCCTGCADAWDGEGSIDLNLLQSGACSGPGGVIRGFYSCPKKSLKYATVFLGFRTSWDLAWAPCSSSPSTYDSMEGICRSESSRVSAIDRVALAGISYLRPHLQ
jgi:hypothetical protein